MEVVSLKLTYPVKRVINLLTQNKGTKKAYIHFEDFIYNSFAMVQADNSRIMRETALDVINYLQLVSVPGSKVGAKNGSAFIFPEDETIFQTA